MQAGIEKANAELAAEQVALRFPCNETSSPSWPRFAGLPWSDGPVEGNVHRLEMLKRQMPDRAGFDLLRLRVLHAH